MNVQTPSHIGCERPNVLAHILRATARQTRTLAKLSAALVGAVLALSLDSMSVASDAIDSQQNAQSCRFGVGVPYLVNHESALPLYTGQYSPLRRPSELEGAREWAIPEVCTAR